MAGLLAKVRTAQALGFRNIARVVVYRLKMRAGMYRIPEATVPPMTGPFFGAALRPGEAATQGPSSEAPPDWLLNPWTGHRLGAERDWWQIRDFDASVGDIKGIWKASRFDWVLEFALKARRGDAGSFSTLNAWLSDWCLANPPYKGPNWKCGQEASIRVMHLAMSALITGDAAMPMPGLTNLLDAHLRRIKLTMSYALAQDNNHGTSEAAALFIGGDWLESQGRQTGGRLRTLGREWLEERVARLVAPDGSFSQYSANYHRLLLDTLSMAEIWRRRRQLPPFSTVFQRRAAAAAEWLRAMTDPVTGDAPNLGANDGARLLPVTESDYRDYRPSVQLACSLFRGRRAWKEPGEWDVPLEVLGIQLPAAVEPHPTSVVFDDGGYAILRRKNAMAVLRYPRFRFRPGQADLLHVDLWHCGRNLLRDAGTFSYGADADSMAYFSGVEGHNAIQFDDREQMPRLGRFLFGDWLKTSAMEGLVEDDVGDSFGAGYEDGRGASHFRRIFLADRGLRIEDEISGFRHQAIMRWRLEPGNWHLDGERLTKEGQEVTVTASVPIAAIRLTTGRESRYYHVATPLPVFEVEVRAPCKLVTEYRWTP